MKTAHFNPCPAEPGFILLQTKPSDQDPSCFPFCLSLHAKHKNLGSGLDENWRGVQYSKTCIKQPLKIDKIKILMTNGSFAPLGSFCNIFDPH